MIVSLSGIPKSNPCVSIIIMSEMKDLKADKKYTGYVNLQSTHLFVSFRSG